MTLAELEMKLEFDEARSDSLNMASKKINNNLDNRIDKLKAEFEEFPKLLPYKFSNVILPYDWTYRYTNGLIFYREYDNRCIKCGSDYGKIIINMCNGKLSLPYISTDLSEKAKYVKEIEKTYDLLVESLPLIYARIADVSANIIEKRTQSLQKIAANAEVEVKEKKITRVVIEIEEV